VQDCISCPSQSFTECPHWEEKGQPGERPGGRAVVPVQDWKAIAFTRKDDAITEN